MVDVLARLEVHKLAAWYRRLADWVSANLRHPLGDVEPLSAQLLRHYLDGKGEDFVFHPPKHLMNSRYVQEQLLYHRAVYLTEKKARLGEATVLAGIKVRQQEQWAGILPRLQGRGGLPKWDARSPLVLHYTANCEVPVSTQQGGTPGDLDLLYALHGFDLRTDVSVAGAAGAGGLVTVKFTVFDAKAIDVYDWSKVKGIKVPNPDYRSRDPDAVTPQSDFVQVQHTNAIRLHDRGLACPFKLESRSWKVTAAAVVADGTVDPTRRL